MNEAMKRLTEVRRAEKVVSAAEEAWEDAKATTKAARDTFDDAVKNMRDIIRDIDQARLEFNEEE